MLPVWPRSLNGYVLTVLATFFNRTEANILTGVWSAHESLLSWTNGFAPILSGEISTFALGTKSVIAAEEMGLIRAVMCHIIT